MSRIDTSKKDSSVSVAIITHDFSAFSESQVVTLVIANYHVHVGLQLLLELREWKGKFISLHLSGSTPAETYHHYFSARFSNARALTNNTYIQ